MLVYHSELIKFVSHKKFIFSLGFDVKQYPLNKSNRQLLSIEMSVKESCDVQCSSLSVLDVAVENVSELLKTHEEEVQLLDSKKLKLGVEVENQKKYIEQLELEKSELDAEVTALKLRNIAYQKEHTSLRNAITIVQYQIEKIKETIAKAKEKELQDLEDFENAVDEITEKFRSGPDIYDRRILLEKIDKEKDRRDLLIKKIEELRNSYEDFSKEKGLRTRRDENEDLLSCVLPGSELSSLLEMTNTLDEVMYEIKKLAENVSEDETNTKETHPAHACMSNETKTKGE